MILSATRKLSNRLDIETLSLRLKMAGNNVLHLLWYKPIRLKQYNWVILTTCSFLSIETVGVRFVV